MNESIKLSVIIPMYNPGQLIGYALDSILNQKYTNYEVIIVDDGSSDNSSEIVHSYCNKYSQILYFKVKNGGASKARNYGFSIAKGDYVYFFDQDDMLFSEDAFRKIVNCLILNKNIDVLIFRYVEFFEKEHSYRKRPRYPEVDSSGLNESKFNLIYKLVENGNIPISPWDKVIRKEFIQESGLYFREGLIANDVLWFLELVDKVNTISVINDELYVYRRQVSSSLTNQFSLNKFINFLDSIEICYGYIENRSYDKYYPLFLSFLAYEYTILLALSVELDGDQYMIYQPRLKKMSALLKYDLNKKVRKVNYLIKFFGLNITKCILRIYIKKIVNKN